MTMVSFRNLSTLANKAKEVVESRGGADALKQDAAELRSIAKGSGSLTDKARAAAEALKRPGEEQAASKPKPKTGRPKKAGKPEPKAERPKKAAKPRA
jgi:hypothetical protein